MFDWNTLTYRDEVDDFVKKNESYVEEFLLLLLLLKQKQFNGTFSQKDADRSLKQIKEITQSMYDYNSKWIEKHISMAGKDGMVLALTSMGLIKPPNDMFDVLKLRTTTNWNSVSKKTTDSIIARLQNDMKMVTDNVQRRAMQSVREIIAENFRQSVIQKKIKSGTISDRSVAQLKQLYGDKVNHVITDTLGRKWKMKDYVDTIVQTAMMEATNQSLMAAGISHGKTLGVITHAPNTKDMCRFHQGRIIKLDDSINEPYPSYHELQSSGQVFHMRCRHRVDIFTGNPDEFEQKNEISDLALGTNTTSIKKALSILGMDEEDF